MKKIDTKSLVIGILATVLVMVTIGAVGKPTSQIGRFTLGGTDSIIWLLDATNGDTYTFEGRSGSPPDKGHWHWKLKTRGFVGDAPKK